MTADGRLPISERRNYKSVFNAVSRICKEEGILILWRVNFIESSNFTIFFQGCTPTVVRSMVVNAAQLATYSQAKEKIIKTGYIKDGIPCHFTASMISGLATTAASMPVDIIKTRSNKSYINPNSCNQLKLFRIQNMKIIDGKPEYNGILDVLGRILKNEGLFSLWKGFTPYYMRLQNFPFFYCILIATLRVGPHTVLTFIFLEQLNTLYNKFVLGQEHGLKSL
jgi:solute carrier family 25 oxoglutarate transporter 11